ncbi:trehalose 6-phosphate phosphatase [Pseudoxanthomonas sp. GM95]|uniref:trehalose-phosphatase n=1 Tax=Pseudoxanthomonas sp. GM95 TaxID=1881043 RepID=UPI0008BB8327|nr:trehalose-phosphatase [Pseudoxanthomonas sp. GM95]SEL44049.1 trehalose 6-phosphate phosphatase [Pseudoxanthomonas sp. GM95]
MPVSPPNRFPPPPALADRCALFLDVDGTLLEFNDDPGAVGLPDGGLDTVTRLSQKLDGALALVSGRPLAELDQVFAPLSLPAAGMHGQQLRGAPETTRAVPGALAELRREATVLSHRYPGVRVEDKGGAIALHWRAAPQAAAALQALAGRFIPQLGGYRLQPGDQVLELVPADVDKGRAVRRLLGQPPFAGRVPVFVGDDLTDEYGFEAANSLGGWSVLVGRRPNSHAMYALPDVTAVHAWLRSNL